MNSILKLDRPAKSTAEEQEEDDAPQEESTAEEQEEDDAPQEEAVA